MNQTDHAQAHVKNYVNNPDDIIIIPGAAELPSEIRTLNIHERMIGVMRDLGAIDQDKKNEAQNFKYRGIDDVYNALNPLFSKHGVFMSAEILGKTREERTNAKGTVLAFTCLRMRYRFVAEDGSSVVTEAEGEGMDSGDKSSNKAMAVAHKYALLQAFCIPTIELDDPDAHTHEVAAKPEKPQFDPDPDGQARNWVELQKKAIFSAKALPDLYDWLDAKGDGVDRLLRKSPDLHKDLMAAYQAKAGSFGKADLP